MKYATAFEIAQLAMADRSRQSWFLPGTARKAALAACDQTTDNEIIEAMTHVLESCAIGDEASDPVDEWYFSP